MSVLNRLVTSVIRRNVSIPKTTTTTRNIYSIAEEGTIASRPFKNSWGLIPIALVSVSCSVLGAMAAKQMAQDLEEWNIFVPEDDEDD